jgi:hypothetical protein
MSSTRLAPLRSNLASLALKRQGIRWGTGWCGLLLAVLLTLAALFVVDYAFKLTILQRVVVLVLALIAIGWSVRRFLLPHLGQLESPQDMALFVERQQQIDSDLIAALQFEDKSSVTWGSTELQSAVVDYVSDFSQGLNVFAGLDRSKFTRRAAWLGAVALALIALGVTFPKYAQAFFQRMALQRSSYPTATQIDAVWVNGVEYPINELHTLKLRSAYGQKVDFRVNISGDSRVNGKVLLTSQTAERELDLGIKFPKDLPEEMACPVGQPLTAELPQLFDDLQFKFIIGDAETDAGQLLVIPLPVVELQLGVTTPEYAKGVAAETPIEPGMRQIAVVEGSAVNVRLDCTNKTLKSVTLGVTAKEGERTEFPLQATDPAAKHWVYKPAANSPLGNITDAVKFDLRVVDQDGLELPAPIEGLVRVKPDRVPSGTISAVVQQLLPQATPELDLRATDDYGLSGLRLLVSIERAPTDAPSTAIPGDDNTNTLSGNLGGPAPAAPATSAAQPKPIAPIVLQKFSPPLRGEKQLPYLGKHKLSLAPYDLKKGDQLKLILEITDDRGTQAGKSANSDPIFLTITDESGVIAASSEYDERAARVLDELLKVQTGGNP